MYGFRKSLIALTGVLTLVCIVTVTLPHIGRGATGTTGSAPTTQTQNVKVVNTPGEAVPVLGTVAPVTGTSWNVNVTNFPSTSNVGIDGSANTVKIDTSNPLAVRDVDNPARQPFSFERGGSFVGPALKIDFSFTVPANKRLVIEQISVDALLGPSLNLTPTQKLLVEVFTFTEDNASKYLVVGTDAGQIPFDCIQGLGYLQRFVASSQMKTYTRVGGDVGITVYRNFNGGGSCDSADVSLSGYLVDVP